jgi:hypothetical protein
MSQNQAGRRIKPRSEFGCRYGLVIFAGFLMSASASHATPIEYTYAGTTLLYVKSCPTCLGGQPVTTTDHISAFFIVDNPLTANFQGLVSPTDWAISDGHSTLTPADAILTPTGNSSFGSVQVVTDGLGAIIYWQMVAGTPATIANDVSACEAGTATCIGMQTLFNFVNGDCCIFDDSFYYPLGGATTSLTELDGVAGTWTAQAVPESSSFRLFGIGVVAVDALRRLRRPLRL